MKLLLAEDTHDLNRALTAMLTMQGFEVDSAFDGEEASALAEQNGYDGLILDIMMPKKDGLQVLREIREKGVVTPVLMLTAKAEIDDRVEGLNAGADDYLTKPFAMQELLARVNALVRRGQTYDSKHLSLGNITLSTETKELTAENSVRLSSKEADTLHQLLVHKDKDVSVSHLLEHVWRDTEDANEETVYLYIKYLKDKLNYINSNVYIEGEKEGPYRLSIRDGE